MSAGAFDLLYITEGREAVPAAEIQFDGQRLCIVRGSTGGFTVEFVTDLYVLGREVKMQFPLQAFTSVLQEACAGLEAWHAGLSAAST